MQYTELTDDEWTKLFSYLNENGLALYSKPDNVHQVSGSKLLPADSQEVVK
jgi:hypothetical protein